MIEKVTGKDLIFISQINRDGSGVSPVSESYMAFLQSDKFTIKTLSFSERTYIASGFNSFVVRLKTNKI